MNELSGCFGPDRFGLRVGRVGLLTAVVVAMVLSPAFRAVAAPGFNMAGELPPSGDSVAVSCRYALMNARLVVDMSGPNACVRSSRSPDCGQRRDLHSIRHSRRRSKQSLPCPKANLRLVPEVLECRRRSKSAAARPTDFRSELVL